MAFAAPVTLSRAGPLARAAVSARPGSAFPARRPARARTMFGFGAASAAAAVAKGDRAPAFSAQDQAGNTVSLSDFAGSRAVALFFYPKDASPGCTKQACAFRDAVAEFDAAGCAVLGVSSDDAQAHASFDEKHKLGFPLLVDAGGEMRRAYGVPATLGVLPGRVTYVIDKDGVVREVYNSQLNVTEHVNVVRQALKKMAE